MKKGILRYFKNAKNRLIFGHYGRNVYIHPGSRIVRPQFISIGDNVRIGRSTNIFTHPERRDSKEIILRIEDDVHIGNYNIIGVRKSVILEENVMLGPWVMIMDHTHHYEDVEIPIKSQPMTDGAPVHLEKGCWVGAYVFISPNVTIGRQAVIGAHSIVNRDIPPYSVAVGSPARVIKRYDFNLKQWVRVDE